MPQYDLLRPLLIQGLFNTEATQGNTDFKSWISSGKYLVRTISTGSTVEIEINDDHAFHNMLAHDGCRMACAAFETMENIQLTPKLPKSFGWIAIKCYYAAFFAAHSILRSFGYTCSQLERGHIDILNAYGASVGITETLKSEGGFFVGHYNKQNRIFEIKKMKNTHEDTWHWLTTCLKKISNEALQVSGITAEKQALSAHIGDLVFNLQDGGKLLKGSYLSQFRNAVNYRHEFNSWHPYGKKSIQAEKIMAIIAEWKGEKKTSSHSWKESKEVLKFFNTCIDIIILNRVLMDLIINNSATKNNFYARWPNKLLNLTR